MRSESVGSETIDDEKGFATMKFNWMPRKIMPRLSISDKEMVSREDRGINNGKNPELARLGDLAGVHLKNNDVERM